MLNHRKIRNILYFLVFQFLRITVISQFTGAQFTVFPDLQGPSLFSHIHDLALYTCKILPRFTVHPIFRAITIEYLIAHLNSPLHLTSYISREESMQLVQRLSGRGSIQSISC